MGQRFKDSSVKISSCKPNWKYAFNFFFFRSHLLVCLSVEHVLLAPTKSFHPVSDQLVIVRDFFCERGLASVPAESRLYARLNFGCLQIRHQSESAKNFLSHLSGKDFLLRRLPSEGNICVSKKVKLEIMNE